MTNIVNKWGNSLGVRIPQQIATEVGLEIGTVVEVKVVDNNIVISTVKKKHTLEDLLIGVTPELIGGEYDWGEPVGNEAW